MSYSKTQKGGAKKGSSQLKAAAPGLNLLKQHPWLNICPF